MRLWTVHPKYLDVRGLAALWREGLLAQKVLRGETVGYRRHPQLVRFRGHPSPGAAIATYLWGVHGEAARRGYCFDGAKIVKAPAADPLTETVGQLRYEWEHLLRKLERRDPQRFERLSGIKLPEPHAMFRIVEGEVNEWERVS